MRRLAGVVLLTLANVARADNDYADCLLDKLADVQNDQAAQQVIRICLEKHPSGMVGLEKRTGWLRKYKNGAECTVAKGKSAGGTRGPLIIRNMCYALYEPEPKFDWSTAKPAGNPFDDPNFGK